MPTYNFRIHKLYSRPINFKTRRPMYKFKVLSNLLYGIAGFVIMFWAIVFFGMNTNTGIHLLLIVAANLILLGIIQHQNIK